MAGANERRADTDSFSGTRKLIRPKLSATERRRDPSPGGDPLSHALLSDAHGMQATSHAEAFYFQKQIQQQTEMTVVLEDGEELHGTVEWYDRCSIKLRAGRQRVLIFKSGIKYLFKTSDAQAVGNVMK
ncbi:MAG: RNA chaperone Hfq [Janthinobacterium lividum]